MSPTDVSKRTDILQAQKGQPKDELADELDAIVFVRVVRYE